MKGLNQSGQVGDFSPRPTSLYHCIDSIKPEEAKISGAYRLTGGPSSSVETGFAGVTALSLWNKSEQETSATSRGEEIILRKRNSIISSSTANGSSSCSIINNGNRTEWSPIRSVIIRVITKLDDRESGVQFVSHEYDY